MSDINETKIMPDNLPKDLEGIYRLMGYEDKNNYDDEEYKEEYEEALGLLGEAVGGGSGGGDVWDWLAEKGMYALYTSSSIIANTATYVSSYAFSQLTALNTVSCPNASYIGEGAFTGCSFIREATFPNVTSIGEGAFHRCANLISLYLTGGSLSQVPTIGEHTFNSTPIGGYSDIASQYGSVYVPASLYESFLSAENWSYFASRIVSVAD